VTSISHRLLAILALTLTASAASPAWALEPYVGLSLATPGEARLQSGSSAAIKNSNNPTAVRLYGGLKLTPEWSVEAGYGAFGSWRFTDPASGPLDRARLSSNVFTLAGRYTLALDDTFSVFGKAGVALNRFRYRDNQGQSIKDNITRPMWGLGVEAKLSDHLSIPIEFESFGSSRTQLGRFNQRKLEIGARLQF
jgi:OOP family OmpA-OmpF porin